MVSAFFLLQVGMAWSQTAPSYLLRPARVIDGSDVHTGWEVLVDGEQIAAAGPIGQVLVSDATITVDLPGTTLLPGLIEGHSHLLLHPYDEAPWNEQVLEESQTLRVARATVHARETLMAGFTTIRDLGTEGDARRPRGRRRRPDGGHISPAPGAPGDEGRPDLLSALSSRRVTEKCPKDGVHPFENPFPRLPLCGNRRTTVQRALQQAPSHPVRGGT